MKKEVNKLEERSEVLEDYGSYIKIIKEEGLCPWIPSK